MGSHDRWMRCFWCGKRGKCCLGSEPTLLDCDGIGFLCEPCYERGRPPHAEYLQRLLGPLLNGEPHLALRVSELAYPVCNTPFLGSATCAIHLGWVGSVQCVIEKCASSGIKIDWRRSSKLTRSFGGDQAFSQRAKSNRAVECRA